MKSQLDKVARTNSRVMLTGPAGAGKEEAARYLHRNSDRAKGPFVTVNSASIAPDAMEEVLFGRESPERGVEPGLFERAHTGILFFDEVADMPPGTQSKILRVLVDQSFQRVGGAEHGARRRAGDLGDHPRPRPRGAGRPLPHRALPPAERGAGQRARPRGAARGHPRARPAPSSTSSTRDPGPAAARAVARGRGAAADHALARQRPPAPQHAGAGADPRPRPRRRSSPRSWCSSCRRTAPPANGMLGAAFAGLALREAREMFEREYLVAQINRFGGNISRTASFVGMERSALHRKLKSLNVIPAGRSERTEEAERTPDRGGGGASTSGRDQRRLRLLRAVVVDAHVPVGAAVGRQVDEVPQRLQRAEGALVLPGLRLGELQLRAPEVTDAIAASGGTPAAARPGRLPRPRSGSRA